MKNRITLLNALSNILLQLFTIISAFIIPKIILSYFGSEVNGLVSSLNQLLNYIALLEGGLNSVIMASLYKPLYDKDYDKLSSIIKTSKHFFRKISIIFVIYSLLLAIIYPLLFENSFSYDYVFFLTLILSLKLFIQYCFSFSLRNLLTADKKVYYISFTQILLIILDIISTIIIVNIYPSIHVLKLLSAIIFTLQPIIYSKIVKKFYVIDKKSLPNTELIKNRWDGFSINVAAFIHGNTDITILSIFENLKIVSVYSIYSLVTNGLKQLVVAFTSGISPSIGNLYVKNDSQELNKKFNVYEYIVFTLVFFLFTIGGLLITPFVTLYTSNIKDINYSQPLFGILMIIAEGIYVLRTPYINLAYNAGSFKDLKKCAYFEAIINIVLSLILVTKFKLVGIAIGTLVAMIYRTLYQVYYLKNHLIYRSMKPFFKKLLVYSILTIIGVLLSIFIIPIKPISFINWIVCAIIYCIIFIIIYLITGFVLYKNELIFIKNYLLRK